MGKDDNKFQMPNSGAGITQYFDDVKSKIELKPHHVVVLAVLVILIEIMLHFTGGFF